MKGYERRDAAESKASGSRKDRDLKRRNDLRLIAGLVLLVTALFAARSLLFRGSGARVIVSQNGSTLRE